MLNIGVKKSRENVKVQVLRKREGLTILVEQVRNDTMLNDFIMFFEEFNYQSSFKCWVIGSISYGKAGPMPRTVIEPALI